MLRIHRLGAYGSEATIIAASISALVGVRPAAFCARLNKTSRCRHAGSKANKPGLISGVQEHTGPGDGLQGVRTWCGWLPQM